MGKVTGETSYVTKALYDITKSNVNTAVQGAPSWVLLNMCNKKGVKELEVECSDSGKGSGAAADSEAKAPAKKVIDEEEKHLAAPPADDFDVEAQGPTRLLQ